LPPAFGRQEDPDVAPIVGRPLLGEQTLVLEPADRPARRGGDEPQPVRDPAQAAAAPAFGGDHRQNLRLRRAQPARPGRSPLTAADRQRDLRQTLPQPALQLGVLR
jgi:hypothetical protein